MTFWDASALVPLCVEEETTAAMTGLYAATGPNIVWWATRVECASALARVERAGVLEAAQAAFDRLTALSGGWNVVEPSDRIAETAIRLLRVHPLRAADALQLAAAHAVADGRPSTLRFVTLDERVAAAARKEGFGVEPRM